MDFDEPSAGTWKPRQTPNRLILRLAIAVAIIAITSTLIVQYFQSRTLPDQIVVNLQPHAKEKMMQQKELPTDSLPVQYQVLPNENTLNKIPDNSNNTKKTSGYSAVNSTLNSFDNELNLLISEMEKAPIHIENPAFFATLLETWNELKEDEKKIIDECSVSGNNNNTADYLIQVYQKKIWLLRQIQKEIIKINKNAALNYQKNELPVIYIKL